MVAEGHAHGDGWSLIFTYGTLKRGFSNHVLLQDLIRSGDAAFVGVYRTAQKYPLVCGPYRVPFLLNFPGSGHRVQGELYSVSTRGLARMDELEGTRRGHYERLPVKVIPMKDEREGEEGNDVVGGEEMITEVEAYYGHRNYAMELWRKDGKKGYRVYSEREARGYVKRNERPQDLTFLDHIRLFLSSPSQDS